MIRDHSDIIERMCKIADDGLVIPADQIQAASKWMYGRIRQLEQEAIDLRHKLRVVQHPGQP